MEPLEIFPNIWLIDLAVHLPEQEALVIADLHLGYEEALHRAGVLVPRQHRRLIEERLMRILEHLEPRPRRLVINGDLKHRFAPLFGDEWREAQKFLEFLRGRFAEVVLLRGNHDVNIEYLVERDSGLKVQDLLREDRLLLLHGDRRPRSRELEGAELILIGHEHPAVGLRSVAGRIEIYKAFLLGEYHNKKLLVQPSFNLLVQGSDLARERAISPLISEDGLGEFSVYPVADEGKIYSFGPLAPLLRL
ncbi:MAG: metallophosphoesterase [Candidatus Bipolaricaulia bacterium]